MLNETRHIGRLTKDAELKTFKHEGQTTSVLNYSLAVTTSRGKEFIPVEHYGKVENVAKYLVKGKPVLVKGWLKIDNGKYAKVVVDEMNFLDSFNGKKKDKEVEKSKEG